MGYEKTHFLILIKLLILLVHVCVDHLVDSSSCDPDCGGIKIPYPFGVGERCALDESYVIECRRPSNTTTSRKTSVPFLSRLGNEVVRIFLPDEGPFTSLIYSHGSIRVRIPITSAGCSQDGKDSNQLLNLTGTPYFVHGKNSLVAAGCNSKASLTHIEPNIVGCESICNTSNNSRSSNAIPFFPKKGQCAVNSLPTFSINCDDNDGEETRCDGNGCCKASLPDETRQVVGIRIESNDGKQHCRVAFLTDEASALSNATKAEQLFAEGFATVNLGWVIQTKHDSFVKSLGCKSRDFYADKIVGAKCLCDQSYTSGIRYANCGCNYGYEGNPYDRKGCIDVDECKSKDYPCKEIETCENTPGGYECKGDKSKAMLMGLGAGLGVLFLVGLVWWLRKFIIKRRIRQRKMKFFKRNGGLLLQQELTARDDNVEKTRIFSSKELEKATENFSENRVLGQGGQGTVYKGMLVDGRTVAVKKSKAIDEDKLQEFINEVVILSQINHRHVVKLLGCCLETEVPILVYEFVLNGNLFQHIHEDSEDYAMVWGVRLRIAVDIAGALFYLHSYTSSPIYHRDIKSANILLDEKYRAKVSDFGTSRSVTIDQTHWTTLISGTVGYVDPEYYKSSQYTDKSDVYSFGVVLAELITGDKPVIVVQDTRETISLVEHFRDAMKEKRFSDIMDARIRDDCKPEQAMAVANLAMKCLSSKGKNRPSMREVTTELERICTSPMDLQVQIHVDNEEEEEEFVNILSRSESWSIGVTAPAPTIEASSSCSDVEPLFPRFTW